MSWSLIDRQIHDNICKHSSLKSHHERYQHTSGLQKGRNISLNSLVSAQKHWVVSTETLWRATSIVFCSFSSCLKESRKGKQNVGQCQFYRSSNAVTLLFTESCFLTTNIEYWHKRAVNIFKTVDNATTVCMVPSGMLFGRLIIDEFNGWVGGRQIWTIYCVIYLWIRFKWFLMIWKISELFLRFVR